MRLCMLWGLLIGCGGDPQCSVVGVWKAGLSTTITFQPDGTWYANTGLGGGWQLQGTTLTLADETSSCSGIPGIYEVAFDNNCSDATLHKKSDNCADRAHALDGLAATRLSFQAPKVDMKEPIVTLPDLAIKRAPDLAKPLDGCNGLLNCYVDCGQNNPVQACYDDCDAAATQHAVDLLNAYGTCIDTNCFQMNNQDSGKPYCDTNSANPTGDPVCNACYTRILGTGGACNAAGMACTNDKP